MVTERDTPGFRFFQKHIKFFVEKDVDGLVASDYNADAACISVDFAVRGREGLKQLFTGYLEMIGDLRITSLDAFNEGEDFIQLEATMETSRAGIRKVYDIFVMKDGKIQYHFTGVR